HALGLRDSSAADRRRGKEPVTVGSVAGRHGVHRHETRGYEQRQADFLLSGNN
ncbi:unnamed protein product, partial [Ectocarpus sp. 8 AP-2014]